ncbi:MAG: SPOR domain-containing protein [Pseudomonadota bacterium]
MSAPIWRWIALGLLTLNLVFALFWLTDTVEPEPERVPLPPLDDNLPRLELVEEVASAPVDPTAERCYTIGPLPTLLAQQRGEDRLRAFASAQRSRQTTADSDRGWWVYLPASNRAEATSLSRELAQRGVEDYYVVTSGAMENSVSVGLFSNVDNARARQARIRGLGFDAQLEIRRETIPQFWIDYRIAPDERSPWRFIVRASPGAQHREIPCF